MLISDRCGALVCVRRGNPYLCIDDVYRCVDEMYADDISPDIGGNIDRARVSKVRNVKATIGRGGECQLPT